MNNMKYPFECSLCETKIREFVNGKIRKTEEYNEIDLKINDGSNMTTAVCSKHTKPRTLDFPKIMRKIQAGWQEEVDHGLGNKEWVETIGSKIIITGLKK